MPPASGTLPGDRRNERRPMACLCGWQSAPGATPSACEDRLVKPDQEHELDVCLWMECLNCGWKGWALLGDDGLCQASLDRSHKLKNLEA
jgi:hypothetical protein